MEIISRHLPQRGPAPCGMVSMGRGAGAFQESREKECAGNAPGATPKTLRHSGDAVKVHFERGTRCPPNVVDG